MIEPECLLNIYTIDSAVDKKSLITQCSASLLVSGVRMKVLPCYCEVPHAACGLWGCKHSKHNHH